MNLYSKAGRNDHSQHQMSGSSESRWDTGVTFWCYKTLVQESLTTFTSTRKGSSGSCLMKIIHSNPSGELLLEYIRGWIISQHLFSTYVRVMKEIKLLLWLKTLCTYLSFIDAEATDWIFLKYKPSLFWFMITCEGSAYFLHVTVSNFEGRSIEDVCKCKLKNIFGWIFYYYIGFR